MRLSSHAICSIAHLPAAERAEIQVLIDTAPIKEGRLFVEHPLLTIEPHPYGFAIHLGIFDDHPERPEAISSELWALLILARLRDAEWLRFDRDEPPAAGLPIFADTGETEPAPDRGNSDISVRAPVTIHCDRCNGTNVMRDAWARWDIDSQQWMLGQVFDNAFCEDCEIDATLVERPVAGD